MDRRIIQKQIDSYKRNHVGNDLGDAERSKTERDLKQAVKAHKSSDNAVPKDFSNVIDEDMESYENALHIEKKALGNAKTHVKRYKRFSQHDDFT